MIDVAGTGKDRVKVMGIVMGKGFFKGKGLVMGVVKDMSILMGKVTGKRLGAGLVKVKVTYMVKIMGDDKRFFKGFFKGKGLDMGKAQ
jgi:hypothetical protein